MSRSGGPSPPMTACSWMSPASTYLLVKVSANPSGRLGAPETEPGPCGVVADMCALPLLRFTARSVRRTPRRRACRRPWSGADLDRPDEEVEDAHFCDAMSVTRELAPQRTQCHAVAVDVALVTAN